MTTRTYRYYDPLAQALDDAGERWALLIVRELLDGPRRYGDLQQRLPGLSTARLADRLRELRTAGLIEEGYELTADGRRVEPAIHALTRFGLLRLRPLPGTSTVYRPAFAAYALRALADAVRPADGTFTSVTHVEGEVFCTRHDENGVVTWAGDPGTSSADVVRLDTVTALSLATRTWNLADAERDGYFDVTQTSDGGLRWACAHGLAH
jgi:DNA-binding HxlR family transcriptional regulator